MSGCQGLPGGHDPMNPIEKVEAWTKVNSNQPGVTEASTQMLQFYAHNSPIFDNVQYVDNSRINPF